MVGVRAGGKNHHRQYIITTTSLGSRIHLNSTETQAKVMMNIGITAIGSQIVGINGRRQSGRKVGKRRTSLPTAHSSLIIVIVLLVAGIIGYVHRSVARALDNVFKDPACFYNSFCYAISSSMR